MKIRNFFLAFLCVVSVCQIARSADAPLRDRSIESLFTSNGSVDVPKLLQFIKESAPTYLIFVPIGLAVMWAVSSLQKQNPDFFNSSVRMAETPFFYLQNKLQILFCSGQSLTWNQLASWHNRVSKLLSPLTKATSVLDLGKERRLKALDIEDGAEGVQDEQWLTLSAHIERECAFLCAVLNQRLHYYKEYPEKKDVDQHVVVKTLMVPIQGVKEIGKACVRSSLTRNDEIAFGIEETIEYLQEVSTYCSSVTQFSALDKEIVKRLMVSICSTLEHLGVLVDEVGAADKTKKKLPMTLDGSVTKGYTPGGGFGGYDPSYGMGGI